MKGERPLYVRISPEWKSVRQKVEAEWSMFAYMWEGRKQEVFLF